MPDHSKSKLKELFNDIDTLINKISDLDTQPHHVATKNLSQNTSKVNRLFTTLKEIFWKVFKDTLDQSILNIVKLLQEEQCIKKIDKLCKRLALLIKLRLITQMLEQIFLSCLLLLTHMVFYVVDGMFKDSKAITTREKGKHSVQGLEAKEKAGYYHYAAKNIEGDKNIRFCKSAKDKDFDHNQAAKSRLDPLMQLQKNIPSSELNVLHAIIHLLSKPHIILPKKDNITKQGGKASKESAQIHKIHNSDVTDSIKKEQEGFIGAWGSEEQHSNNKNNFLKGTCIIEIKCNEIDKTNVDELDSICSNLTEVTVANTFSFNIHDY